MMVAASLSSRLSVVRLLLLGASMALFNAVLVNGWAGHSCGRRPATTTMMMRDGNELAATAAPSAVLAVAATAAATIVLSSTSLPLPSYAADANIAHGAELFKAECAGCHLGGNNFMSEKKTLKKDALQQYQSLDAAKLQDFVSNQMPHSFLPFHSKWSADDFGDVVAFVLDQAVNDKWE